MRTAGRQEYVERGGHIRHIPLDPLFKGLPKNASLCRHEESIVIDARREALFNSLLERKRRLVRSPAIRELEGA